MHSHPAISREPGGLWLLSLHPHIQVTSRCSCSVSLGLLLSLSWGWKGLREGICLMHLRLTPGLAKNSAPSNSLPPSSYPQLLIYNPNELLTVPICSSLACWGKGERGGDNKKGETERTVGFRCSAPASSPAAGLLGIYGLHGCHLPSCQRLPLSHTPGGPTPEGERVFDRRGCNHFLSCPDP